MVDVHPSVFRLSFLLAILTLALPQASAGPLDRAEDLVKVEGADPHLPPPVEQAFDSVEFAVYEGDPGFEVGALGLELQMQAGCSTVASEHTRCSSNVCIRDSGSGPYPVSIGNDAEGYRGFGVDIGALGIEPSDDQADDAEAGSDGEYGPYHGAFISENGQCGA